MHAMHVAATRMAIKLCEKALRSNKVIKPQPRHVLDLMVTRWELRCKKVMETLKVP